MSQTSPRVVVTGAMGSGKSLVCSLLSQWGVAVIDADRFGHAVLEPEGEAYPQVAARWPEVVSEGRIVRPRLGEIVFSDPAQLSELMTLTHPHIRARILGEVDRCQNSPVAVEISAPSPTVMPDWPVLVVDADPNTIHRRLLARGMSEADIGRRMASQRSREGWLEMADYVIPNRFGKDELAAAVERTARQIGLLSQ